MAFNTPPTPLFRLEISQTASGSIVYGLPVRCDLRSKRPSSKWSWTKRRPPEATRRRRTVIQPIPIPAVSHLDASEHPVLGARVNSSYTSG